MKVNTLQDITFQAAAEKKEAEDEADKALAAAKDSKSLIAAYKAYLRVDAAHKEWLAASKAWVAELYAIENNK